jgi:hypothetical protein
MNPWKPGAFQQGFGPAAAPSAGVSPSPDCSRQRGFILAETKNQKNASNTAFVRFSPRAGFPGQHGRSFQEAIPVGVVKSFATLVFSSSTVTVAPGVNVPQGSVMPK